MINWSKNGSLLPIHDFRKDYSAMSSHGRKAFRKVSKSTRGEAVLVLLNLIKHQAETVRFQVWRKQCQNKRSEEVT